MKLYNRGSSYYTILTIPRCLVSEYGKKQIWKSLRTNDYKLAKLRAEFETMAIRQKLLNDVKKIKAQNQTADLYFDDDDEETDDIQVEDKMDFSQFSDEDFLNADDKTISLMGNETFSKYHKIKYAYDKKMARINKIRNSTIEYDQREAEDFAYDWLLAKAQHETKRLQNVTNKAEERKYYQDLLNAFEYKYTQWDYRDIENEVKTYFYEKIISQPSPDTKDIVLNAFMRAKIQFLRYIIEYIKGYRGEIDPELINSVYYNQLEINAHLKEEMNRKPDVTLMQVVEYYNKTPKRDNTSEETKERVAAKMNIMADLLGANKPIRKITSDDIQELLYTVSYIPKHFGIGKTQGKTIQEAVNMARADETLPRISVKTQGDYVQTLIRDENNKIDIIVDSKQASIIMKLFRAYATEQYTIKQVFELARSLGLVNQQGNAVSERCVNNILKNPFYYGKIRINNQLMPHKYQTFIEKSLFDRVQEVMDSRRIKK